MKNASMDEEQARSILGQTITNVDGLFNSSFYLFWDKEEKRATLDGRFTAEQLEAIAWWMKNKS